MIDSTDGRLLNNAINPNNSVPNSREAGRSIQTRVGGLTTYQQHAGPATHRQNVTQVQMAARTGLVTVAGHQVTEDVAATLAETAPELFVPEEEKVAAAKAEATDTAKEAADRESLNRLADDAAEGVAMHISNDVEFGDQVRLLHELHTTGNVSAGTLNRVADQLHMSVEETVAALNAISTNTTGQLQALCNARGVADANAFSSWLKASDPNAFFKAVQVHTQDRDMVRAWDGHIAAWKARGQK
jgi:hypothetical protein